MKKSKLDVLRFVIAIVGLLVIAFFPIIIWDALGNGAQHFMQYGNPGVSGDSSGGSSATFLFGTFYTANFNVVKLFSGQWRVVEGVNQTTDTKTSGAFAVITLISVIGLLVVMIYEIAMFIVKKIMKDNKIVSLIDKYGNIVTIVLCALALVFVGIPTIVMASKITKFGFRNHDFNAYGGIKGIIEMVIAFAFIVLNVAKLIVGLKGKRAVEVAKQ